MGKWDDPEKVDLSCRGGCGKKRVYSRSGYCPACGKHPCSKCQIVQIVKPKKICAQCKQKEVPHSHGDGSGYNRWCGSRYREE